MSHTDALYRSSPSQGVSRDAAPVGSCLAAQLVILKFPTTATASEIMVLSCRQFTMGTQEEEDREEPSAAASSPVIRTAWGCTVSAAGRTSETARSK